MSTITWMSELMLKYPGFFNIDPGHQTREVNIGKIELRVFKSSDRKSDMLSLDQNYGISFDQNEEFPFGNTDQMEYYYQPECHEIIDELRVPFRKIPVFKFENDGAFKVLFNNIIKAFPKSEVCLRGQRKVYRTERNEDELKLLYGCSQTKEPSFTPSFARKKFSENFMTALWHSQTANMFEFILYDFAKNKMNNEKFAQCYQSIERIRRSPHFTPLALAYAQHYGLPSVGLDLTREINVAKWFATFELNNVVNNGNVITPDLTESTIFIFACRPDSVFSHRSLKPRHVENTRPDRQDAWFNYSGWGSALNQLALQLVCAVRLDSTALTSIPSSYHKHLFPGSDEDIVLRYYQLKKNSPLNVGEVIRAFENV